MLRELPKWYHCKVWKMMLRCDANGTDWGYQTALRWRKHPDGHYCAFTVDQHNRIKDFVRQQTEEVKRN